MHNHETCQSRKCIQRLRNDETQDQELNLIQDNKQCISTEGIKYSSQKFQLMRRTKGTVFLEKYTCKRTLGRGAFGEVYLVEAKDQQKYALKVINKTKINQDNQELLEYLQSQIQVMKQMNHRNLVKLYSFEEDEHNYYMLMEYCDLGDVINLQLDKKEKVFPLEEALLCLKQVIDGLEYLHAHKYLHRDIKMQNILAKTENGEVVYKLGDFGFAKKNDRLSTVLGTEMFMSPEIYKSGVEQMEDQDTDYTYGYEVDMWAFGVVFFYMLNKTFPFDINVNWGLDQKYSALVRQAKDFSYSQKVSKSQLKLQVNCTQAVENLFSKIFEVNPQKRINFADIRHHEVFRKMFSSVSQDSIKLYSGRLKFKPSKILKGSRSLWSSKTASPHVSSIIAELQGDELFEEQHIVSLELEQIDFLWKVARNVEEVEDQLGLAPCVMLTFNLLKAHIVLKRNFLAEFNSQVYFARHKGRKWVEYFSDQMARAKKKECQQELMHAELDYEQLYKRCNCNKQELSKLNPHFSKCFRENIIEEELTGDFENCYRSSTDYFYMTLKSYIRTHKDLRLYYFFTLTVLCHFFKDLMGQPKLKEVCFQQYLSGETQKMPLFSYDRFYKWLGERVKEELLPVAQSVISEVLGWQ